MFNFIIMPKIKKGDTAKIMKGKDAGKTGKVIHVDSKDMKVTLEGLNVYKKHVRPKRQGEKGQIVEIARPMAMANVEVMCPGCGKPTRIGYRFDGKTKVRYCKKCEVSIAK